MNFTKSATALLGATAALLGARSAGATSFQGAIPLQVEGKCFDVPNANSANGTGVEIWDCNGGANQEWIFETDGTVRPAFNTNKCLDIPNGNTADGTRLEIWDCYSGDANQQWTLGSDGTLRGLAGKCVDNPDWQTGDGTMFDYWTCNGGSNQQFQVPASLMWRQDTVKTGAGAGCGREIAVGPNDVPWVIGCNNWGADNPLYYLNPPSTRTDCGSFCISSEWTYYDMPVQKISVSAAGELFGVNSIGDLWYVPWQVKNGRAVPSPPPATDWTVAMPIYGCLDDMINRLTTPIIPTFEPSSHTNEGPQIDADFWSTGCGAPNTEIFRYLGPLGSTWTTWMSAAPSQNPTGDKLAMFTQPNDLTTATPWSMTVQGWVWRYNFNSFTFESMPEPIPGLVTDITDHFAVGSDGNVYQLNDSNYQSPSWHVYLGWAPNGLRISRVAYAQPVTVGTTTYGPSELWVLDSAGNIWYAAPIPGVPG